METIVVTISELGEGQEKILIRSFNNMPFKFKIYLFEKYPGKYIMLEFNVNERLNGRIRKGHFILILKINFHY